MASSRCEELQSDKEPLHISAPTSPPPISLTASLSKQAPTSLIRSWPSSHRSPWDESCEVTARLYSSLQLTRDLQAKGQPSPGHTHRQVSFQLSSPQLGGEGGDKARPPENLHTPSPGGRQEEKGEEDRVLVEEMGVNLQTSVDYSNRLTNGRRHIQDMENVRAHLQTMLRSTPILETEGGSSVTESPNQSFNSESTSQLLGGGIGGLEELFPRYSFRLRSDGVFSSPEATVLRESLDRERTSRKQCEGHVLVLQSKALELQQRLALALSADRKKDVMIEQLDKTLAKVVEGWRKHEQEKSEGVKRLQQEKELAERRHTKQQETLGQLEQSLAQVAEALEQEQKHTEELQRTNRQLELRLVELEGSLCDCRHECELLCVERDGLHLQAQEAQAALTCLQEQTANERRSLEDQTVQLANQLQEERECKQREEQHLLEVRQVLEEVRGELTKERGRLLQLEEEKLEARGEWDTERMDWALEQARFEAQRSQLEVKLKQETERLSASQQEHIALKEQHRNQLLDLSARHERELSSQLQQHQQHTLTLTQDYQTRLAHSKQQSVLLEESRRRLEGQREELVSRLQSLLRSHWTEALRLLSTQAQPSEPATRGTCVCVCVCVFVLQTEGSSLPSLWDEPKDWMNQHLLQEPSSSSHITVQYRAAADTHMVQREQEGEEVAHLAQDAQAVVLRLSRERGELSGEGEARAITEGRERRWERGAGREESGNLSVLNHTLSFNLLEPQLDTTNMTGLEELCDRGGDLRGCVAEEEEHKGERQRAESGERQQWAERGPSLTSGPSPSFDPGRRSELQYYVSMLLDRSPGEPVENPAQDNTGLGSSWDSVKFQLHAPLVTPSSPGDQTRHPTRNPTNTGQVSAQLRSLLAQFPSQPDRAGRSLQLLSTLTHGSDGECEEKPSRLKKSDPLLRNSGVSRVTSQGSGLKGQVPGMRGRRGWQGRGGAWR
ncbi:centrobin isoform X3 [Salvelinus fontinalis]|uniref:centrobin isoform X3 n=1 Tax=Salvelinus fontinalis TaxID=8038 RepID=UPI002485D0B4|nr:centrobin isoform X3 [Salvelinus fontinalis]